MPSAGRAYWHLLQCETDALRNENLVIMNTEIMMEAIRQLADGSMRPAVAKTGEAQHSSYLAGVLAFE